MTAPSLDPLGLTAEAFVHAARPFGAARPAALAAYRAVFREGAVTVPWVEIAAPPISAVEREGETVKFLLELPGGHETEAVVLPQEGRSGRLRTSLCVSSQVGCALGCRFCETARMGLVGDLSPSRIVAQWFAARFVLGVPVDNVVFMGMGEPLENLDAVLGAVRVLTDRNGPAVSPSRITISTVGRADGLARLAEATRTPGLRRLRLAVSVNAPNDEIRSALMPINRAMPMAALREALGEWTAEGGRRVLVAYVLIPGVNDAAAHADEFAAWLGALPATVNVIPYNPRRDSPWPAPAEDAVDRFTARLRGHGVFVKRRITLGRSVMAACGQLGNPAVRARRRAGVPVRLPD